MLRTKRNSGIELLRILAIIGVVVLHYNSEGNFLYIENEINRGILMGLESICICAVDVFILISGYFLSASSKRNMIKPVELIVQVIVFRLGIYFLRIIFVNAEFSLNTVFLKLFPNSYFVILYVSLYIISPYLNRIFIDFSKKEWNRFILTILLLFSVWPTFVDVSEEIIGEEWFGLSTIGAWGAQQGFNIINFILLYFIGAYLRFNGVPKCINTRMKQLALIVITGGGIFVWSLITLNLTCLEARSSWHYHNPLVVFLSVLLFILFKSFSIESKIINELAKASFTCFLFHEVLLALAKIKEYVLGNPFIMVLHIVIVAVSSYLISYVVYKIYSFFTKGFLYILRKSLWKKEIKE